MNDQYLNDENRQPPGCSAWARLDWIDLMGHKGPHTKMMPKCEFFGPNPQVTCPSHQEPGW